MSKEFLRGIIDLDQSLCNSINNFHRRIILIIEKMKVKKMVIYSNTILLNIIIFNRIKSIRANKINVHINNKLRIIIK